MKELKLTQIFISLPCVLPTSIRKSSFNNLKPAIDFYKEDLEIYENNIDYYMLILKNEFELWKEKWSNENINVPKNSLGSLSKCLE